MDCVLLFISCDLEFVKIQIFKVNGRYYFETLNDSFITLSDKFTVTEVINEIQKNLEYTYVGPVMNP